MKDNLRHGAGIERMADTRAGCGDVRECGAAGRGRERSVVHAAVQRNGQSSTPGVILIASRITVSGRIGCRSAHTVVHAYLHAKLADLTERCAGDAVDPPFLGCRVGRHLCRATANVGASGQPQLCSTDGIRVRFRERDKSVG